MDEIATLGKNKMMAYTTRSQMLLEMFSKKNPEIKESVEMGDVFDMSLKHRVRISPSSGNIDLIKSGNKKREGVSDFEDQNLDDGQNLILDGVGAKWGSTETDDTTDQAPSRIHYVSTYEDPNGKVIPAQLLNSTLVILRNRKPVFALPLSKFIAMQDFTGNDVKDKDSIVKIEQVKLFTPKDKIYLQLYMPEATAFEATTPATYYYLEVSLDGLGTGRNV